MTVEPLVSERLLRRVERLSLRVHSHDQRSATGEHRGRGQTSSFELSDHRAYAPGDDFRRVDWNAFARLDSLNVKLAEPQQNDLLHLLVDCSTSMEFGSPTKARVALQVASCLAWLALNQLDGVRVYGVRGRGVSRSPRYWGKGQAAEALRWVASLNDLDRHPGVIGPSHGRHWTVTPEPGPSYRRHWTVTPEPAASPRRHWTVTPEPARGTDLDGALAEFLRGRPERGLVVLLSDLLSPTSFNPRLRQLGVAGFEVALVQVLSEVDLKPGLSGNLEILDSETGQRRRIGATPEALLAYECGVERWREGIASDCRDLGVRYIPLLASQPIESVILSDLRRYGLLE